MATPSTTCRASPPGPPPPTTRSRRHISPISPLYLPYISPISPLHHPYPHPRPNKEQAAAAAASGAKGGGGGAKRAPSQLAGGGPSGRYLGGAGARADAPGAAHGATANTARREARPREGEGSSRRRVRTLHLPYIPATSPYISPTSPLHLPTSPHISPTSPHISPHLRTSPHISPHLAGQVRIKLQGARSHVGKPKGGKEQRQRAKARRQP